MEEKSLVQEVIKSLPNDDTIYDLAELFKNFGDSTRIKILLALSKQELCVNDITKLIGVTQSAVSHQLRILKQAKLVRATKKGKEVYYALDDDHVNVIINKGLEHVNE